MDIFTSRISKKFKMCTGLAVIVLFPNLACSYSSYTYIVPNAKGVEK